jgi:hypothetical protein
VQGGQFYADADPWIHLGMMITRTPTLNARADLGIQTTTKAGLEAVDPKDHRKASAGPNGLPREAILMQSLDQVDLESAVDFYAIDDNHSCQPSSLDRIGSSPFSWFLITP